MPALGRSGCAAGALLGALLALGFALQTAGLERTTVSNTGFITGLYVVLTPLFALVLFRQRITVEVWIAVALALVGLATLNGVPAGSSLGLVGSGGCALILAGIVLAEPGAASVLARLVGAPPAPSQGWQRTD